MSTEKKILKECFGSGSGLPQLNINKANTPDYQLCINTFVRTHLGGFLETFLPIKGLDQATEFQLRKKDVKSFS
jgi:hypothetical protein